MDSVPPDVVTPVAPGGAWKRDRTCNHTTVRIRFSRESSDTRAYYHCYNLRFHLAHSRKDIRMNRVGHSEHLKCFCLYFCQILAAVVYGSRYSAVFPSGMLHPSQLLELFLDFVMTPSFSGQLCKPFDSRTALNETTLDLLDSRFNFFCYLFSDTWEAEKVVRNRPFGPAICVGRGAENASSFELVVGGTSNSRDEEYQKNIAQSAIE